MGSQFVYGLHENPIIAAINDTRSLEEALQTDVKVVFLLKGNILDLKDVIQKIKDAGKFAYVHVDLVDGLSKDENGLKFIISEIKPDGIITTKSHLIKLAKREGVFAIQRLFILDSLNLKTGIKLAKSCHPDAIEILPGIIPSITEVIKKATNKPIITGGLIRSKTDVMNSLTAGAMGVSTSNKKIWVL